MLQSRVAAMGSTGVVARCLLEHGPFGRNGQVARLLRPRLQRNLNSDHSSEDPPSQNRALRYPSMLLDVAESVLGVFRFSGTQLRFQRRPKSFLEELRGESGKETLRELESLEDGLRYHSPWTFP
jgi:hypothetical protein